MIGNKPCILGKADEKSCTRMAASQLESIHPQHRHSRQPATVIELQTPLAKLDLMQHGT